MNTVRPPIPLFPGEEIVLGPGTYLRMDVGNLDSQDKVIARAQVIF